jgi:signal transduction histidine kinase
MEMLIMSFALMRKRASLVLALMVLIQIALLGVALVFLIFKLQQIHAAVTEFGHEEDSFLRELADAESDLYRTSLLLRDDLALEGAEQLRARQELIDLFTQISTHPVHRPTWISAEMRQELDTLDFLRRDYVERARIVTAWPEQRRKLLGISYLSSQLAPARESFVASERKIGSLVRAQSDDHDREMAEAIERIEWLVVRTVAGAVALTVAFALFTIWRFRRYENERESHLLRLEKAEGDLRTLSHRLVLSQEIERKNLSRDLHDEVGQLLTALRVQLGQIEPAEPSLKANWTLASHLADKSLRSVRAMARGLRPAMLDDLGLAPALQWLGREVSKTTPLNVEVQVEGAAAGLSEQARTSLFRVAQEALTNCVKHASSANARVSLRESAAEVVLTVQDDGKGFTAGVTSGIGLLGMRERMEELGGALAVIASPGNGTTIRANLPKTAMERK